MGGMFANFFSNLFSFLSEDVINVCRAILLLFLAYIVAGIAKSLILAVLRKAKVFDLAGKAETDEKVKSEKVKQSEQYVGKLIYLLVFLLFVPGIFSFLGISQVADPILRLLSSVWGYVPNILAAVIVILVGNLVAKLVRQLLVPLFERLGVDKLQEKAGMSSDEDGKLSATMAYIVYVLILIPVGVVALQALGIEAIAMPAISMLSNIFAFIPNIAVAVVMILIGGILGKLVRNILRQLLASSGVDLKLQKMLGDKGRNVVLSKIVSETARVIIVIFFIVEGMNVLHLSVMTKVGATVIDYMPNVLASLLILLAAILGADAAENALKKSGLLGFALVTRITIITVGVFMILSQLGIASEIVSKAFLLLVAAVCVAFGVAFGVGGREFAKTQLARLDDKLMHAEKEASGKEDETKEDAE
ncbi:MAG: mechanosensitive ion channel [Lachnospiraceae bacterium]|nr:mechanosensitive ion channel [Lachnospiraceae bacterium]